MVTTSIAGSVTLDTPTTSIANKNSCNETNLLDVEPNVHGEAKPISPPQKAKTAGFSTCLVEYDHKPYSITWKWMGSYPDLTKFPPGNDVIVPLNLKAPIWPLSGGART
ncbi:hypothetical protein GGR51DRAFT_563659 [Nemania sp. FL0031]|nr:hypothetical protein GGR51DRAFT_563659 [Nemania sp. FL0031]